MITEGKRFELFIFTELVIQLLTDMLTPFPYLRS
jgi:hypothetical protein